MESLRKVDFADAVIGKAGCIYKAGLTSDTAADVDGQGLGYDGLDWAGNTNKFDYSSAGAIKNTGVATDNNSLDFTIPAAIQEKMATRGAVQFSILLSEITNQTGSGLPVIKADGTALTNKGFVLNYTYQASGGYAQYTNGYDGTPQYGHAIHLASPSNISNATSLATQGMLMHENMETDSEGYVQLGISWNGGRMSHYMNGVPVSIISRGDGTDTDLPTPDMILIGLADKCIWTMKDFMIFDRPFDDFYNDSGVRILGIGHSFMDRNTLGPVIDKDGVAHVGGVAACGALEQYSAQLYKRLPFEMALRTYGYSGQDMSYMYDVLNGYPIAYSTGSGTNQDVLTRFRAHFVFIYGPMHNGGYDGTGPDGTTFTSHADAIHEITNLCMTNGAIPIWIVEPEKTLVAGDFTAVYPDVIAELNRQQAVNDIGIVDLYAEGLSGNDYVTEADGSKFHGNLKVQSEVGRLMSIEIQRLHSTPPDYSRLANSEDFIPVTIAAP